MSEIFNSEKSPVEELRDVLPGTDGFDFGLPPLRVPADSCPFSVSIEPMSVKAEHPQGGDFGTSPHGLSAELHRADEETLEAVSLHSPAKPLLTSPSVYHTAELQESCRIIEEAAAKRSSGFFGLTLTQEQCRHLAFAVLEQIESLEESYEADEPEVQDALRCLLEVQLMMERAAKQHAYKTGQAKGAKNTRWRNDSESLFDEEAEL